MSDRGILDNSIILLIYRFFISRTTTGPCRSIRFAMDSILLIRCLRSLYLVCRLLLENKKKFAAPCGEHTLLKERLRVALGVSRVDDHVILDVDHLLEACGRHGHEPADPARHRLEEPD